MDRRKRYRQTVALMSMLSETKTIDNVDIATFDGNGADLLSLIVGIDPIQDLHGYDSPWPAGGGKNKWGFVASDFSGGVHYGQAIFIDVPLPEGTYTVSTDAPTGYIWAGLNTPQASSRVFEGTSKTITLSSGDVLAIGVLRDHTETALSYNNQIESGSTATTYAPYENLCPISGHDSVDIMHSGSDTSNPTTYTIPLGETVYGGTLDVTGGKMYARPYFPSYNGQALVGPWVSSMDAYTSGASPTVGAQVVDMGGAVTEITLDPVTISTIAGQTNNVWADTGKIIFLEYEA